MSREHANLWAQSQIADIQKAKPTEPEKLSLLCRWRLPQACVSGDDACFICHFSPLVVVICFEINRDVLCA